MEPLNLLVNRKLVADDTRRQFGSPETPVHLGDYRGRARRWLTCWRRTRPAAPKTRPSTQKLKVTTCDQEAYPS